MFTIQEGDEPDRTAAHAWWLNMGFEREPADAYVQGFASGALTVWEKVEDALD